MEKDFGYIGGEHGLIKCLSDWSLEKSMVGDTHDIDDQDFGV